MTGRAEQQRTAPDGGATPVAGGRERGPERPFPPETVIRARGLRRSYGDLDAVAGVDLEVSRGEVFAFLGPNGAGKTTTVEILEGYRERSGGEVEVLGIDPADADRAWRQRVGIVLQQCRMQPELTVRETLELYAGYYESPRAVEETIELVGLGAKADARAGSLSGGQQRRLDVGLALVGDPELLFLDEPTTGFDPTARRQAWQVIASLSELGKTVFLTTHYMEEAQALAERVAILSQGRIVAEGTPAEIGGRDRAAARIAFRLPDCVDPEELPSELGRASVRAGGVELSTDDPVPAMHALTGWALERGLRLDELQLTRPSLEDVYIELTSTGRDGAEGGEPADGPPQGPRAVVESGRESGP